TLLGFAISVLVCAAAPSDWLLIVARCAAGIFGGIIAPQLFTIIADVVPSARRGTVLGALISAHAAGALLGMPIVLFVAEYFRWTSVFAGCAVGLFVMALLVFYLVPELRGHLSYPDRPTVLKRWTNAIREPLYRRMWLLTLTNFMGYFVVLTFLTPFLSKNLSMSINELVLIYASSGCVTFFTVRFVGRFCDRKGAISVYRAVALAGAVFSLLITLMPSDSALVLVGIAMMCFMALSHARNVAAAVILAGVAKAQSRGTLIAMNLAVQQIAIGTSALLAALLVGGGQKSTVLHYERVGVAALVCILLSRAIAKGCKRLGSTY
ncbi:MAG: MFS transporter, partial [Pseudomonadota bacterium]